MVDDIILKVGNKDIKVTSEVIDEISKNGIEKPINILLKRKNKLIRLKVKPTDITNLEKRWISQSFCLSISTHLDIQVPSSLSQLVMHSK